VQARARERENANRMAFTYDPADPTTHSNIGKMDKRCLNCGAIKFKGETKGLCCSDGKVVLEPFSPLPPFLNELISGEGPLSKHFLNNIRLYNGSFAMTSFGHKEAAVPGWNPSFRIHGQAFHRIGSLVPPEEGEPKFLQVYFLDTHAQELATRNNVNLKRNILEKLTQWLHENNHLVRQLKTARDVIAEGEFQDQVDDDDDDEALEIPPKFNPTFNKSLPTSEWVNLQTLRLIININIYFTLRPST
jgi:hypothetical protein